MIVTGVCATGTAGRRLCMVTVVDHAVVDECGECGGDGIADGACDCDGNVEDCAGDCGGDAVVDECGECGGDGIADCETQIVDM